MLVHATENVKVLWRILRLVLKEVQYKQRRSRRLPYPFRSQMRQNENLVLVSSRPDATNIKSNVILICDYRQIGPKAILVPYKPEHVPVYHEWMKSPFLQGRTGLMQATAIPYIITDIQL
jgi:hypothetical protein